MFFTLYTARFSHLLGAFTATISIIISAKHWRCFSAKMTANKTTDNVHKIEFVAADVAYALLYNLYSLKRERYGHSEN
jgi:hypothetical protein